MFSESPYKVSLVERAQRTFQNILYKYMNHYNTNRYIDLLPEITATFNSRVNRTIKMSPNNAYKPQNTSRVLYNLEAHYTQSLKTKRRVKFRVGMKDRILILSKSRWFSRKPYTPNFTREIFTIHKVDQRLPYSRYYIKDSNNEVISGSFQAYELSKVV